MDSLHKDSDCAWKEHMPSAKTKFYDIDNSAHFQCGSSDSVGFRLWNIVNLLGFDQSCEMSSLLHGANFLNQILPQESAEIAKYLAPRRNKMKTKGYFWGTKAEHSII